MNSELTYAAPKASHPAYENLSSSAKNVLSYAENVVSSAENVLSS